MSVVRSKVYSVQEPETNIHSNGRVAMSVVGSKMMLHSGDTECIFETQLRIRAAGLPAETGRRGCDARPIGDDMSTIAMTHMVRPAFAEAASTARGGRRPRLRMTRRGRAVLLTVLALPLAGGIAFGALNGGAADATHDAVAPLEYVTVASGQTLWSVATEVAPGADPRDVISDLMTFNRLASADVPAGLHLAIPPKYLR